MPLAVIQQTASSTDSAAVVPAGSAVSSPEADGIEALLESEAEAEAVMPLPSEAEAIAFSDKAGDFSVVFAASDATDGGDGSAVSHTSLLRAAGNERPDVPHPVAHKHKYDNTIKNETSMNFFFMEYPQKNGINCPNLYILLILTIIVSSLYVNKKDTAIL